MVQGYYTLQEAAQVLGMAPEELKQMAQTQKIRSFQDRGTWRFRVQDIQELARQRGAASDLEMNLGEMRTPQPKSGPRSGPKSPAKSPTPRSPRAQAAKPPAGDVFDFAVDAGLVDLPLESPSGPRKGDSRRPSPQPAPGSDSDVRLVAETGDVGFAVGGDSGPKHGSDSDVKLVGPAGAEMPPLPSTPKMVQPGQPPQRRSGLAGKQATPPVGKRPSQLSPQPPGSGARLTPPKDSDSDVKIVGAPGIDVPLGEAPEKTQSDSDIRLEPGSPGRGAGSEGLLTEEIDLDAELKRQELGQQKPQAKVKPKSKLPRFPQSSPFELTESDVGLSPVPPAPRTPPPKTPALKTPAPAKPDSSDYELTPGGQLEDSSEDFTLDLPGDSDFGLQLGDSGELKGPTSGINLSKPVDSGISLESEEKPSDSVEFELSLDVPQPTPKPAAEPGEDSSSEFELTLDVEDSGAGPALVPEDSDSEFELTLDDSGELGTADKGTPQTKSRGKDKEKDIFETDFDMPGAEDGSGSQVAALETDLDSSDFDLAVSDSDIALDEDSGSQVVALDEEEAEPGAATVAAKRKTKAKRAGLEEAEFGDFETEPPAELQRETVVQEVEVVRYLKPAPWGVVPTLVMLPCLVVMVLIGIMGFELLQQMTSHQAPGPLTKAVSEMVGKPIK